MFGYILYSLLLGYNIQRDDIINMIKLHIENSGKTSYQRWR